VRGQADRERAVLETLHGGPRTLRGLMAGLKTRDDYNELFRGDRYPDSVRSLIYATAERLRKKGAVSRDRDDEGTYVYATIKENDHQ